MGALLLVYFGLLVTNRSSSSINGWPVGIFELIASALCIASGQQITMVEALVRWPHPVHGLIPPIKFLPLAEEAGLVGAITRPVLARAIEQCAAWRSAGREIRVACLPEQPRGC
jgi:EAL domain-containing protein (putative c-di-GMP-specific phosphodiesterase class I)